jgi:hypothetical protein
MGSVMTYALRRTSARVVVVVGIGGLVMAVFRALRPARTQVYPLGLGGVGGLPDVFRVVGSSPWDLVAASLGLVLAVVAGASLFRPLQIRR